jgi:hypothetical protein
MAISYQVTSHESFGHDSVDSLSYDWERIGNPGIAPKPPLQAYFPQTTEEVASILKELAKLQKPFKIRSNGHSSNDLVLADRGTVICMQRMNKILRFDPQAGYVTVQAGAVLADVDTYLIEKDFGLPIIGDHNHITAGGFASVGGISPASHRYGMFVDNVLEIEYVTNSGEIKTATPGGRGKEFQQLLAGLGRYGVITTLKCRVISIKKLKTILRNDLKLFTNVEQFARAAGALIASPGEVVMERGLWVNLPVGGWELNVGQFSAYHEIKQGLLPSLVDRVAYGYLHALGYVAGRLPKQVDVLLKYLGMAGIVASPLYASVKNVERFTDTVIDSSVGDPTRMFIILGPAAKFEALFHGLYELCVQHRRDYGCFKMISIYVKAIRSQYLAAGRSNRAFCELMLYVGIEPKKMTPELLDAFATKVDDLAIAHGAFRYMHSRTSKDPARRQRIDPNLQYVDGQSGAVVAISNDGEPKRMS